MIKEGYSTRSSGTEKESKERLLLWNWRKEQVAKPLRTSPRVAVPDLLDIMAYRKEGNDSMMEYEMGRVEKTDFGIERDNPSVWRGVGWLKENGVRKVEAPAEVRSKFIELLGRAPNDDLFDGGKVETVKMGKNKGKIIEVGEREFVKSEDTVILTFSPSEVKQKGIKRTLAKAKFVQREVGGEKEVQRVDPTWKQIMDLRQELGEFPNYVYWKGVRVRVADDGYGGNSEITFERGIAFELIEIDVLKIASREEIDKNKADKYREEYLLRQMEENLKTKQKYV